MSVNPVCLVVTRRLGVTSEVWLYRQLHEFHRFDPQVICWSHENQKDFPADGIPIHSIPFDPFPDDGAGRWQRRLRNLFSRNYYGTVGKEAEALHRAIRKAAPAVILAHFGPMALRILPVAVQQKVPLVVHFHGVDITAGLRNPWYRKSLQRSLSRFAALVVVADYQRETLISMGAPPEKIHVIPCGVPMQGLPSASAVGEGPCRFVSLGRLVEKKAPLHVVRAFADCQQRVPSATLTMIGSGRLLPAAKLLADELGVAGSIRFTGPMPSALVLQELSAASVFLQHSVTSASGDKEGWPVSIAEAMGIGLPVISTSHAGITQQVADGESGYLVAENDWQSMARRMEELALNPEKRREMGQRSAQIARSRFDQKELVRQLEQVMSGCIERVPEGMESPRLPAREVVGQSP